MIAEAFLLCALSPQPMSIAHADSHAFIRAYQMMRSEQERLTDWIRKRNPGAEVFIHPTPQEERLKDDGWERVPFTWRGNKIWIKRKPNSDIKHRAVEASA